MVENPTPDDFEIDSTEESSDEERDQLRYEISYYPSDVTLKGYLDKWNAKATSDPRIPKGVRLGSDSRQQAY